MSDCIIAMDLQEPVRDDPEVQPLLAPVPPPAIPERAPIQVVDDHGDEDRMIEDDRGLQVPFDDVRKSKFAMYY